MHHLHHSWLPQKSLVTQNTTNIVGCTFFVSAILDVSRFQNLSVRLCPVGWQFGDKLIVAGKEGLDLRRCQRFVLSKLEHFWEDESCAREISVYKYIDYIYIYVIYVLYTYTIYNTSMYSGIYVYINFMLCLECYSNFKSIQEYFNKYNSIYIYLYTVYRWLFLRTATSRNQLGPSPQ